MSGTGDEPRSVDLHGLTVEQAHRRLAQGLHAARVRGDERLVVITGRGLGSRDGRPVLRDELSAWLRGAEARALGVKDVQVTSKGGALEVRLR